jgi:hypothetical protein
MSTQDTTTKVAKRKSVTLTAGTGDKAMRLTILARRTRDGGETVVSTTDVKKKTARGMTTKFATFELAVETLGKLVQDAVSKGWQKPERSGGFKPRPDAFSAMPAAPKAGGK